MRPSAGVVVTINPDRLMGVGLAQSWNCVDAPLGQRRINGQPLSRVHVELTPQLSYQGAVLCVQLDGTSVGQSTSRQKSTVVALDTLTQFQSKQQWFVDSRGIVFSEAKLEVQSNRSLNQTDSKNPFAGALVKAGLKHFDGKIDSEAEEFSRRQIQQRLASANARVQHQARQATERLLSGNPLLAEFAWLFSSDSENVYIASASGGLLSQPIENLDAGLSVAIHESVVEYFLNRRLENRVIDSAGAERRYTDLMSQLNLPQLEQQDDQDWSVKFGLRPVELKILDNGILFELKMESIQSGKRTLTDWELQFRYRWERQQQRWQLTRDERVELVESGQATDSQGARQQVFRTVMRKRFENILPEKIAIPELGTAQPLQELKIELDVKRIIADNRNVVISFDRR